MTGVKYAGFLDSYSGMATAARNYIHALNLVGVPITTELIPNLATTIDLGEPHRTARNLLNNDINYSVKILHITPDMFLHNLEPMKYHIAHFFWETDRLPPQHVWGLNLCDEIWTGSEWSKRVFRRSGVKKPIYVFPQPVETGLTVVPFEVKNRPSTLFYSVFQWIERKNPRGLLEAYWKEFEGNDDVALMIKTYKEQFTNEEKVSIVTEIKSWKKELGLSHYPKVFLHTDIMSKEDVLRFHATGDCFVSAHRGEGWCVPVAEAMSLGKPVISTNLGGVHEFVPDDYWFPLDFIWEMVHDMDWIPFYKDDQRWARVNEKDIRTKLRTVYSNRGLAEGAAIRGQKWVEENLNYARVGNLLKERLELIGKD